MLPSLKPHTIMDDKNVCRHVFVCGSVQAALFIRKVFIFIEGFRFFSNLNVIIPQM